MARLRGTGSRHLTGDPFGAIVFDLDGVLVDTEIWWDEVRHAFAARRGLTWTAEDQAAVMGHNSRGWSVVMRDRLGLDEPVESIEREVVDAMIVRYQTEPSPAIPGAVAAAEALGRRYPLGLASSAHPAVIEAALRTIGLTGAFRAVAASDEVAHGKPSPDVYLLAATRLGVAPGECLVVEDSLNGVLSARAAGMTVVLVPNHAVPPAPGAAEAADAVCATIAAIDPHEIGRSVKRAAGRAGDPHAQPRGDSETTGLVDTAPMATIRAGADAAGADRVEARNDPVVPSAATRGRPRPAAVPVSRTIADRVRVARRTARYLIARTVSVLLVRSLLRVSVEGRERLPEGAYLICFSHGSWADPFVLMAVLPWRPRLSFFGPKEEDMSQGGRNRLMSWAGNAIPYRPGKNDLLDATRRVQAVFDAGGVLAIAGEGRIHAHEGEVMPLNEGAAYFAVRAGVPILPLVINGMSWFTIGSRVRIRIGEPIETTGRPTREVVDALTTRTMEALVELSAGARSRRMPGRFGRWLTELFNEWPEGSRPD